MQPTVSLQWLHNIAFTIWPISVLMIVPEKNFLHIGLNDNALPEWTRHYNLYRKLHNWIRMGGKIDRQYSIQLRFIIRVNYYYYFHSYKTHFFQCICIVLTNSSAGTKTHKTVVCQDDTANYPRSICETYIYRGELTCIHATLRHRYNWQHLRFLYVFHSKTLACCCRNVL